MVVAFCRHVCAKEGRSVSSDRPGATPPVWRRSLRCVAEHHCVEVASIDGAIALRNSQQPTDVLLLSSGVWRNLIAGVKAGEFDSTPVATA
jgi:hypothetical protein